FSRDWSSDVCSSDLDGNEFGQGVEYFRQNTPRSSRKYPFGIHIQPTNIRKNADWPKRTAIRLRCVLPRRCPYRNLPNPLRGSNSWLRAESTRPLGPLQPMM